MVKTMKYRIVKPVDMDWKAFSTILYECRYEMRTTLNRAIQHLWEWEGKSQKIKIETGEYPDPKKYLGKSLSGHLYDVIAKECIFNNTGNLSAALQQAQKKYKDLKKQILKGEVSLPSYRDKSPIYIHKDMLSNIEVLPSGDYTVKVGLISLKYKIKLGLSSGSLTFVIDPGDKATKVILDRCISGEYKAASPMIIQDKKGNWYFVITYSFESKPDRLVGGIMGIDMGVVNPACIAVYGTKIRHSINGSEVDEFRRRIEARKRQLQKQGKYCGEGRIGHGTKKRVDPLEFASDRIKNFRDTYNHKLSRFIVDYARRNDCGTIQIEDLSGITENTEERYLKDWTYFDLQNKLTYKAAEYGIKVIKIDPSYTSQRCSECGHIDSDNRPSQAEFECTLCGYKTNADYNAARNISTPDIDKIIKNKLSAKL